MIMYVYFVIYEYIQCSGIQKHHELFNFHFVVYEGMLLV